MTSNEGACDITGYKHGSGGGELLPYTTYPIKEHAPINMQGNRAQDVQKTWLLKNEHVVEIYLSLQLITPVSIQIKHTHRHEY